MTHISITDVEQPEGNSGTTSFEFTVSLSAVSEETVTVDYATVDGKGEAEARLEDNISVLKFLLKLSIFKIGLIS